MGLWPQQLVETMPTIQVRGASHLLGIDANDSGGDRFTNTCGACDVNHLSCVHGGVQDSDGDRLTNTCPMLIPSGVHGDASAVPENVAWTYRRSDVRVELEMCIRR